MITLRSSLKFNFFSLLALIFYWGGVNNVQAQNLCAFSSCQVKNLDFSTGYDFANNYVVSTGATDPYWRVTQAFINPVSSFNLIVKQPAANWNLPSGNSQWLGFAFPGPANVNSTNPVPFTFERCIDVCGPVQISPFRVFAAEEIVEIRINGLVVYTSNYTQGSTNDFQNGVMISPTMTQPNLNGQVCLEVDVNQHTDFIPLGVRVEGTIGQGTAVDPNCVLSNSVNGFKFHDRNANGIQDFGDSYLPGWTVKVMDTSTGGIGGTAVTDQHGNYRLDHLPAGDFLVEEANVTGWAPIVPANGFEHHTLTNNNQIVVNFGNQLGSGNPPPPNTCPDIESPCATNTINLTTGVDHASNSFFSFGVNDPYWHFSAVPVGSAAVVGDHPLVISIPNNDWNGYGSPNPAVGRWLAPTSTALDSNADTGCPYTYSRCFSTCEDGTIDLNFTVYADNHVPEIRIDGQVIASYTFDPLIARSYFEGGIAIHTAVLLPGGTHCLEIDVINYPASADLGGGPTETGFKLEGIITGKKLIRDECVETDNCQQITLSPSMMKQGLAGGLVNEQSQFVIGDPANGVFGNPAAPWHNSCWPAPCPAEVDTLDLGAVYNLCDIYLYDGSGSANFMMEYWDAATGSFVTFFNGPVTQDQFVPINAPTQYIRFTNNRHADIMEIVLYGVPFYLQNNYQISLNNATITSSIAGSSQLIDEQGLDPFSANPAANQANTAWTYGCWSQTPNPCNPAPNNYSSCSPVYAELNLGGIYRLDAICLFDGTGCGDFGVEYDDNGNWVPLINPGTGGLFNTGQYQQWRIFSNLSNVYTSKLRFTNTTNGAQINEVILYGRASSCNPAGGIISLEQAPATTSSVIEEQRVRYAVEVYPNPTNSDVNVVFPGVQDQAVTVYLYSITGERLKEKVVEPGALRFNMPLHDLPPGTYFMHILSKTEPVVKRVVKH